MKHIREDYNRIQDPSNKIPDNEPVFLIRGQDVLAPSTLRHYAEVARLLGCVEEELIDLVDEQACIMETWQAQNISKIPDLLK